MTTFVLPVGILRVHNPGFRRLIDCDIMHRHTGLDMLTIPRGDEQDLRYMRACVFPAA